MKKILITIIASLAILSSNAQTVVRNNYDTPVTEEVIQHDEKENAFYSSWGLSFYSFKGGENYGTTSTFIKSNNVGFEFAIRTDFKSHSNYNMDLGLNYSFYLWGQDKTMLFFTPSAGLSLRIQDVLDNINKYGREEYKTKFYLDVYANPRLNLMINRVHLSVGYYMWAAEAKFEDPYLLHGFQAGIGVIF